MLDAIILQGCPYSMAAKELLDSNNKDYEIKIVTQDEKHKYKTNQISTFPQIYLRADNEKILIGGYDTLRDIHDVINKETKIKNMVKQIKKIKNISKKQILRIIETFIRKN